MRYVSVSVGILLSLLCAPVRADVFPETGPPGMTVNLGGGEFGQFVSTIVNRVEFNGVPALIQLWEPDLIMVKVPLLAKSGKVTVHRSDKTIDVGRFSVEMPTITKVSPSEVEPGSMLTVEGEHFGNTAGSRDPNTMFGVNQVLINGLRAHVRRWRANKIEVEIPANAKSGDVVVRLASSDPLPDGSCCAPVDYAVSNAVPVKLIPAISFAPERGPVGSKVVLSGQKLGSRDVNKDAVLFNGQPAVIAEWADRTIVVHVPLNATTGVVTLRRAGGDRELGTFHVVQSQVTDMLPAQGPVGTLVRIKGENFGVYSESGETAYAFDFDPGQNVVEFGGVPAIVHRWQDTEINVWVPFSAKSGKVVVKRGATIPKPDGSCCAKQDVVSVVAGDFTVQTPVVTSYAPQQAGLDEVVTIKGSGFGSFLKIAEHTRLELNREAHDWKSYRLGPDVSRSEVLINGMAAQVLSWQDNEIRVRVPRRHVFGIGNAEGFDPSPTTGVIVVRRGSWDLTAEGKCCTPKQWVSAVAGEFTILPRGLPDPDYFHDFNPNRD